MPICPRCRAMMTAEEAICPACRFAPGLGQEVSLSPARAGGTASDDFELPPLKLRRQVRFLAAWRWWQLCLFEFIPGLGHLLDRQPRLAAGLAAVVVGAVLLACWVADAGVSGMLFGLAASAHAWGLFDLTPWRRSDDLLERMLPYIVIMLVLYTVVYRSISLLVVPLVLGRHEVQGGLLRELAIPLLVAIALIGLLTVRRWLR